MGDEIKNTESNYKKLVTCQVFSENITTFFTVINDFSLLKQFLTFSDKISTYYLNISNFSRFYKRGSQLIIPLDKKNYIVLTVLKIIQSEYFCQIYWNAKKNNKEEYFYCEFNFHYKSEFETFFLGIYYIPKFLGNHSELMFQKEDIKRKHYYTMINDYLISKDYHKTQTEVYKIIGDFKFFLKLITNVKIMSDFVGKLIYSSGKDFERGTKMYVKVDKSKSELLINCKNVIKNKNEFFCNAEVYNKVTKYRSSFSLHILSNGKEILIIFTNTYNFLLTQDHIQRLSSSKSNIINQLRSVMEKHNNKFQNMIKS